VASLGVSQDRIYSVGTCRLCQSERELRRSHVIPEFLYGASYDEKHRLLLVPGTADEKPSLEQKGLRDIVKQLDATIGLSRVRVVHANDSKTAFESHVDRHEHIGKGALGLEAFRCLMNDPRFRDVPKVLETPKEDNMDIENLRVLRGLLA